MRNLVSAGRGAKPRQNVRAANMRKIAETGLRQALDQNFRGRRHFLPRQARGVIVNRDPGQGGFCLAEVVEAAR